MEIKKVAVNQVSIIKDLAYKIWPNAYGKILSEEQMDYMLELIYSEESLKKQIEKKHQFYLVEDHDKKYLGFVSFEINCEPHKTKIQKIYILPETQGKGIGKLLFEKVKVEAVKENQKTIFLNVNKFNKAQEFYSKLGFTITKEEIIDIGKGYVMDDYVMEIQL